MTYKHKLARRLAQSRMLGALIAAALVGACSGSTDSVAPSGDPPSGDPPHLNVVSSPGSINSLQNTAKCMAVPGGSTVQGTQLISWDCIGGSSQTFTYNSTTQELKYGSLCVAASGMAGADGDAIVIWACDGGANQKWTLTAANELKGINARVLGIAGGSATNGAQLVLQTANGSAGQKWNTSTLGGTVPTPPPPSGTGEQARMADALVDMIGVSGHLEYGNVYSTGYSTIIKPRLIELGARHFRSGLLGQSNSTVIARQQDLAANGVKFLVGCWPINWNTGNASHCLTGANQLGPSVIAAIEGGNEWDCQGISDWPTKWVQWQTTIWNTFKGNATWASTPVYSNAMCQYGTAGVLGNRSSIMDAGNMHPYAGGDPPENVDVWLSPMRSLASPKGLVATEAGYHNCVSCNSGHPGIDERGSGKYYGRLWFEFFNRGIQRVYAYELIDESNLGDIQRHFGLLRADGSPKPQFTVTKNIISILKDPGSAFTAGKLDYTLSGATSTTRRTLLQKRDGRFYLVLWQGVRVWDRWAKVAITNPETAVTLSFPQAVTSVKVYRPNQSASPISQTGSVSSVSLRVPDEILIVEITR